MRPSQLNDAATAHVRTLEYWTHCTPDVNLADAFLEDMSNHDASIHPVCGNGVIEGDEECDDANDADNDGCSACIVESNYRCDGMPSVCLLQVSCEPALTPVM